MKNIVSNKQGETGLQQVAPNTFKELVQLKRQGDRAAFNLLLLDVLPEVKKFVNRRLDAAVYQGNFPKSKYKAEDFIDQLFIEVYESIGVVENENDFYIWLFKKTNDLVDRTIAVEAFEDSIFKNIDEFATSEWKLMSEKFSAEADGDLIMREDLEDVSYHKSKHTLITLFDQDEEKDLIAQLDQNLSQEDIDRYTEIVLRNFPQPMHTVFELFTKQEFTLEQIAEIIQRDVKDVESLLREARAILYNSLSAWTRKN
ncbi:sigma-70 family RNA polymerase sigma factor [Aureitalea sp. L0-47]|uniref:RNA polymerase sigma factor n=1 Tax=Aureitalea sp. L0-47 TaxID=2816962 RepID=UPI002238C7ED|nr:sigma-70 family RNA polymerase sigma factor [Aureitalea sp. L0-47]MCW5521207.1 sigma-70 family RNA polymerase sigma factor [Aureitalea sp. L0-47]